MERYYNGNHDMLEESTEATASNFSWCCPGSSVSTPKKVSRPPPGTRFNPEPCFPITPMCSMPPPSYPAKCRCSGIKALKNKKQKTSFVGSNQIPSRAVLKPKKSKKNAWRKAKNQSVLAAKNEKKNVNIQTDRPSIDPSQVPPPVCSCTGMPRPCHKCGNGRWQSACCNSNISAYPLPKHPSRPGARVPGRKMGYEAYAKLVATLAAEGHNLLEPIDLKDHWARHGTSKFVTIE